jgi:hypothetical protein
MLDQFTRFVPAISLLAAAALSVFNVGYFWRIGLHYIGLADLSNVIYSLGLATVILALIAFFIPNIVHRFSQKKPNLLTYMRSTYVMIGIAAAIGMFAEFAPRRYVPSHTIEDELMLLSVLLALLNFEWVKPRGG